MIAFDRLRAVPTFVLLDKKCSTTVATYLYEGIGLIDLDASREVGGFVFLDGECVEGAKEYEKIDSAIDSADFERVGFETKNRKACIIRYNCEDGDERAIGYCYTTDGQKMYGEYLHGYRCQNGAFEVVQWAGGSIKEMLQDIADNNSADLNGKDIIYKTYK